MVLAISALFGNINVSGFGGSVGGLICVQKGGRRELGDYKYSRLFQGALLEKQRNEVVAEVRRVLKFVLFAFNWEYNTLHVMEGSRRERGS